MYEPIFSISDPVELPDANDPTIPRYKLYDANVVLICSLFGGVLGGCLLMALNYRRMGQKDNAVLVALAGAVVTATAIALGSVIPKGFELPIGIGLFFATRSATEALQGKALGDHVNRGGATGSGWAAFGLGFVALAILCAGLGAWYGGAYVLQSAENGPMIRIGAKDQVYYSGSATKQDAQSLGGELKSIGFLSDKGASVLLRKESSGTTVSFVVGDGVWDEPGILSSFEEIGREIAPSVGGYPIQIRLMNTKREVEKESAIGRVTIAKDSVYYLGTATEADSKALGQALKSAGFFVGRGFTVLLSTHSDGTTLSLVVKDGYWNDPDHVRDFETIVRQVAASVGGLPTTLHLVNSSFEVEREVMVQ